MSYNSPFTGNVIQPTDVSYASYALTSTTGTIQLEWPLNGNDTDYVAARIMQVSTTSSAYELWMPPANQVSVGQDALIRNTGGVTLTVKSFGGATTLATIPAAGSVTAYYLYITANPTTTGTWGSIAFGAGTSSADAATLAGYGLTAIASTLNQSTPVTTFSTNYTAVAADRAAVYVYTGGASTLTLTSAVTLGNNWFFQVRNAGSGTLTVAPSSGQLIDGGSSLLLAPSEACFICCSGTAFFTIGLGRNTEFNFTQLTYAVTNGTYTLTSSQAANVIQKYTGTLTGNVTVYLPQTVQVYYILNQTDGGATGYTITFRTNAGVTATVAAGSQSILVCDSANVYVAISNSGAGTSLTLTNGSVGSPSLAFVSETNTGIYRPAAFEFGISVVGTQRFKATTTGATVTGLLTSTAGVTTTTVTATTGISGGTF